MLGPAYGRWREQLSDRAPMRRSVLSGEESDKARYCVIGAVGGCVSPEGRRSYEAPVRAPMEVEGRTVGHRSGPKLVRDLGASGTCKRESPPRLAPHPARRLRRRRGPSPLRVDTSGMPAAQITHRHERSRAPTSALDPAFPDPHSAHPEYWRERDVGTRLIQARCLRRPSGRERHARSNPGTRAEVGLGEARIELTSRSG